MHPAPERNVMVSYSRDEQRTLPRPHLARTIVPLTYEDLDGAAALFAYTFDENPFLRRLFALAKCGYRVALREFFYFTCEKRGRTGGFHLGCRAGARLLGGAGLTPPEFVPWPHSLAARYERFRASIGPDAASEYERFITLVNRHRPVRPHHTLEVIGIRPQARGQGHGRALLDAIHARAEAHPTSTGVYAETTSVQAVALYEHFGYRVVGWEPFDEQDIWCLFRPNGRGRR